MTTQPAYPSESHRYERAHAEDADFIVYQRNRGDGVWQTISAWMIPRTECR